MGRDDRLKEIEKLIGELGNKRQDDDELLSGFVKIHDAALTIKHEADYLDAKLHYLKDLYEEHKRCMKDLYE